MRFLADTHVLIWAVLDDPAMPARFSSALSDPDSVIYVSAVSVLEVSIKRGQGKLAVPMNMFDELLAGGAVPLPVTFDHARAVEFLPRHHADPFDRLLIAQALVENLTMLTTDRHFPSYGLNLL